jgi:D-2-hydroxyacid dehydrogenase (NADP+)
MSVVGVSDARTSFENYEKVYRRPLLTEAAALANFMIVLAPLDAATTGMINATSPRSSSVFGFSRRLRKGME